MDTEIVSLNGIIKRFRTERIETTALNDIALQVLKGEFLAIMGPSGCGKSTLLNILGLLDRPSAGSLHLLGNETSRLSERQLTVLRRKHIGFIFQSFNLIEEMTVRANIELALRYQGLRGAESRERSDQVMGQLGIQPRADHYAVQLSGGQRQRVAIARAIAGNPQMLLADEPTGNLDETNRHEVLDILVKLNQSGATIIMVTHSEEDAARASRLVRLDGGRIVDDVSAAA